MVEKAAEYSITVCIENLSEEARDLEPAFHEIPALMMTLDLGHGSFFAERTVCGFYRKVPGKNPTRPSPRQPRRESHTDDLHLPPGEG